MDQLKAIETQELITKLRDAGLGELVECLLTHEQQLFTKKTHCLNKSAVCRLMGLRIKQLEGLLLQARRALGWPVRL